MTVGIIGSCVSRDPFEVADLQWPELAFYSARSSFGSAFAVEPFPLGLSALDPDDRLVSPWQRRMVGQDLERALPALIAQHPAHDTPVIVVDFIDERFDLLEYNGRVATYSAELRMKSAPHLRLGLNLIKSGSDGHFDRWRLGLSRFLDLTQSHTVLLNNVLWAHRTEDGTETRAGSFVDRSNAILSRFYDHAAECGMRMLFEPDFPFIAASEHRWGVAPFHFGRSVAVAFHERLVAAITGK